MTVKAILSVTDGPGQHWVGDGFPVRTVFSYSSHGHAVSPFLMLDHAGPADFPPADKPRGVGPHPHRGIETVTIVYQGEVAHRDSAGNGGVIGPGDVQWMTAGAGILHEEFHSPAFTRTGGTLEMAQLWVNLPARDKVAPPGYQAIVDSDIPAVALPDGAGTVRVIAGRFDGHAGPARTFTPMDVWDVRLDNGGEAELTVPKGRTLVLVVLRGLVRVNAEKSARANQTVTLSLEGTTITVMGEDESVGLLLSGVPIDEPIAGYGPFVMNTREEILKAINDFNNGRFGKLT